ncbi:MAG: hypothetical protein FD152_3614 [Xanthobacteraceae bacterium]|nr:MAG: hypothetical protein FD152_3614 [Xanthobacteraceae bacterium]
MPPATARRAPSSNYANSTTPRANGAWRWAVRSDLSIERQITATGATWLDRQAIARKSVALGGGGFSAEVHEALDRRTEHLIGQGLAERQGHGVSFSRNLLETLRRRELDAHSTKSWRRRADGR